MFGFTTIGIDFEQPLPSVKVISTVPALIPVTKPELFTVAILLLADDQLPGAEAVDTPVNCIDPLTQTAVLPVIDGDGLTITDEFATVEPQLLVTVRLILKLPVEE